MKKKWIRIGLLALAVAVLAGCSTAESAEASATKFDGTAVDNYGAAGAIAYGKNLTVEQMLTYAIEDEYLARQTYADIMDEYGGVTPFRNIILAEEYHIEQLIGLFDSNRYTLPEDTAASYAASPRSFEEALKAGAVIEEDNIAMYEAFLTYDLPDDVRAVFEELRDASENHLAAFKRDHGSGNGSGDGSGYGRSGENSQNH